MTVNPKDYPFNYVVHFVDSDGVFDAATYPDAERYVRERFPLAAFDDGWQDEEGLRPNDEYFEKKHPRFKNVYPTKAARNAAEEDEQEWREKNEKCYRIEDEDNLTDEEIQNLKELFGDEYELGSELIVMYGSIGNPFLLANDHRIGWIERHRDAYLKAMEEDKAAQEAHEAEKQRKRDRYRSVPASDEVEQNSDDDDLDCDYEEEDEFEF